MVIILFSMLDFKNWKDLNIFVRNSTNSLKQKYRKFQEHFFGSSFVIFRKMTTCKKCWNYEQCVSLFSSRIDIIPSYQFSIKSNTYPWRYFSYKVVSPIQCNWNLLCNNQVKIQTTWSNGSRTNIFILSIQSF